MKLRMIFSGIFAFACPLITFMTLRKRNKIAVYSIACLYLLIILFLTVFREHLGAGRQINLNLFWSYGRFRYADIRWQIYMNVFLFIPFGFFFRWIFKRNLLTTLLTGMALSAMIELTQFVFKLGLCELDDVFHNSLGTVIGYGYWELLNFAAKRFDISDGHKTEAIVTGWTHFTSSIKRTFQNKK